MTALFLQREHHVAYLSWLDMLSDYPVADLMILAIKAFEVA
jgi:hypothetical protein